jgi:CheY-specific phosphatase CheX
MHVLLISSENDQRTPDMAQALVLCGATCVTSPPTFGGDVRLPRGGMALVLDTPERSAPSVVLELRRHSGPSVPVLVVPAADERSYSAKLVACGATVVLPSASEIEAVCAEMRALEDLRRHAGDDAAQTMLQPFIAAAIESFQMMADLRVRMDGVGSCVDATMPWSSSALIYLLGSRERVLVINCGPGFLRELCVRVLRGAVVDPDASMMDDALGEMVNIIAGLARSRHRAEGDEFEISTPTVVRGDRHRLSFRADLPGHQMRFSSRIGLFALRLGHRTRDP